MNTYINTCEKLLDNLIDHFQNDKNKLLLCDLSYSRNQGMVDTISYVIDYIKWYKDGLNKNIKIE